MSANPIIDIVAGNAHTTSATTTTLITLTPPADGLTIHVHWTAVGIESVSGEITTYEAIASFKNPAGAMAQSGTTTILHEVDEDTNVVFVESAVDASILLRVTPSADTSDWSAWAQVTYIVV